MQSQVGLPLVYNKNSGSGSSSGLYNLRSGVIQRGSYYEYDQFSIPAKVPPHRKVRSFTESRNHSQSGQHPVVPQPQDLDYYNGPQSMIYTGNNQSIQSSQNSGASSLPYISRSLSIDAYTQQQLENQSKKSTKNCELEEYAKRFEGLSRRRGSARHANPAKVWQRQSSHQSFLNSESESSRCESVISNSSNETLRYQETSFDSSTPTNELIQPPSEFKDLKRFPLQTYPSQQSLSSNGTVVQRKEKSVPNLMDPEVTSEVDENYSFLDPDKRLRVSDNTLKLIQKQALLDYYERNHKVKSNSKQPAEEPDSGFYSPTGPPKEDHSAVINGGDHPEQSSTELNEECSILRGTEEEEDEEDIEVEDILNDEEIDNILEAEDDEDESARPVYLQERYNGGTGTSWSSLNKSDSPPERPPKKPHLRGSADSATPPITPPRGATPSSRPPSRSSNATPPSRGTTPNSSMRGRPKFPSPPGSPEKSRLKEMTPPPPPMETNFDYDTPTEKSSIQDMPLPSPPPPTLEESLETEKPTLRIRDKELQPIHINHHGNHHHQDDLGREGKYRRTSSPTICSTPNVRPSINQQKSQTKSPARTPKRDSPATIAAKGAPGWEKFLGGKTSTVQFTSEEVQKLKSRQQQYKLQNNQQPQPKPRTSASGLLESSFEEPPVPQMLPPKIGLHSKSTPSLEQGPQLSPRSTASEPQPKTSGGRWKNSLDSLHQSDAIQRGFTVNQVVNSPPQSQIWHPQTSHSHSNSDSGLSSISGRASTMSPISTMSTVSSVSSASSSGSSSRASLRSASIVSSCTIPLDEEDEEELEVASSSPSGTILSIRRLPEESQCELLAQQLLDIMPIEHFSYKKLVSLIGVPSNPRTSLDYMKGLFEGEIEDSSEVTTKSLSPSMLKKRMEHQQTLQSSSGQMRRRATGNAGGANSQQLTKKKEELVSKISNKVEMLRVELQSLKSETKTNEEIGRQITVKVMQVAQPNECEKFKLHVEEIDKITSLLVGLAGRLAKAENSFSLCTDTTEKETLRVKRDKLAEQLDEAKKLKANIDKRSSTVLSMLRKYLSDQVLADYDKFIKAKARLIMESRQINDKMASSQEQKTILKETTF